MLVHLFTILALIVIVLSTHLRVLQPLEVQLPLVARIDHAYNWTFSNNTFGPVLGSLQYSTSTLPDWLSLDVQRLTFHGRPSAADEGYVRITLTATDSGSNSTASTSFDLCITKDPEPQVSIPIWHQFVQGNPSVSSVSLVTNNSALATSNPALRIPPEWSFSIGFEYGTCQSSASDKIFYDARCRDGADLPEWMFFNPQALTINGVAPRGSTVVQPAIFQLSLFCSDRNSFSAVPLFFDLIVAEHELSTSTGSLPPVNITFSAFNVSFSSPSDFSGILVDGKALQPHQVLDLTIDVTRFASWLTYDLKTRSLSGDPRNTSLVVGMNPPMPVTLKTAFNQTLQTSVSLNVVHSYFSTADLPPIEAIPGQAIQFNLAPYFSNSTANEVARLTASLEPPEASQYLQFDQQAAALVGTIPLTFDAPHISVIFTAFSTLFHSTSHAHLVIILPPAGQTKNGADLKPGGRSAVSRRKLVLALSITFGIFGGLCLLIGLMAIFRRWARVPDSATGDEEKRNAWSEQDQRWYNQGLRKARQDRQWANLPGLTENIKLDYTPNPLVHQVPRDDYGSLGLGLHRVPERSESNMNTSGGLQSPGVMSKRDFVKRIRNTVRAVSDRTRRRKVFRQPPFISNPILPDQSVVLPGRDVSTLPNFPSSLSDTPGLQSHPGSTVMLESPSASTTEHSIPRRRADFGPPKIPAQVHLGDNPLSRQSSAGSTNSSASNASTKAHIGEGVVRAVSKVVDLRGSAEAAHRPLTNPAEPAAPLATRPRLVPFTSETRVPFPRLPESISATVYGGLKRINSQAAKVWTQPSPAGNMGQVAQGASGDEVDMALHYLQSMGTDRDLAHVDSADMVKPVVPPGDLISPKKDRPVVLRSGETFRFRIALPPSPGVITKVEVKTVSGRPLPKFLHVDDNLRGFVEFHGTAGAIDVGRCQLGIYGGDGSCIKTMIIEVVKWR